MKAKPKTKQKAAAKNGKQSKAAPGLSLPRFAAEGEKLVAGVFGLLEKCVPADRRGTLDGVAKQSQALLERWTRSVEKHAREIVGKLDLPTKQELEKYEKRLEAVSHQARESLDAQIRKALNRLDVATKKDVQELSAAVAKLKKDLAQTRAKAGAPPRKRPTHKMAHA